MNAIKKLLNRHKPIMRELLKRIRDTFLEIWTNKLDRNVLLAGVAITYLLSSLGQGEFKGVFFILYLLLFVSLFVASFKASHAMYMERETKKRDDALANPPGYTYAIKTVDGADIGQVDEATYIKAKFDADHCPTTLIMQMGNYLWVTWSIAVRALTLMSAFLVACAFAYQYSGAENIESLTIGQILASPLLGWSYFCCFSAILLTVFLTGRKNLPGYVNFYERRLRRLLSNSLPNIANAHGFDVLIYKIDEDALGAGSSESVRGTV
ncbi:hypothetical protein [Alteromonas macleodii]|uniref:ABC transmembrane type-1 domain-containing protein n=1 Tax=Alteromonas macleodii TaxID=28108 RepID=A0AB36FKT9_ALTMA|nr:hypothetical protein [Alteromonas macleodii]OES24139.1 hypothetical protein BFV93_4739 [Alteromonas macleodii]OES24773.1 hypothetical protein BFV95_4532 [Alteromonas macleodii]OES25051.1 hypothetical protein BFV94_4522 [Alteromonas macleodii]OES39094.1 hypothetical protein BFV96_4242 [Alteromonas macleodii]